MGNKFYAVVVGEKTGIFTSWDECRGSVEGFPKAKYKSFEYIEDAEKYYNNNGVEDIIDSKEIDSNEIVNRTHSIKISKEWSLKLIEYMKSIKNVKFREKEIEKPPHKSYQFIHGKDKITFNVYETGMFVIQGKTAYLYSEAISFLGYCPDITIEEIIETNIKLQSIEVSNADIKDEMAELLPNTFNKIDETIIKILSPSLALSKLKIKLDDYSCFAFPALRALEGYLKYILFINKIEVDHNFGKIFDYNSNNGEYSLKKSYSKKIDNIKKQKAIEYVYDYFNKNRHTIFHADQILIQSRILEDKAEADMIIQEVIRIIEDTYNDIIS